MGEVAFDFVTNKACLLRLQLIRNLYQSQTKFNEQNLRFQNKKVVPLFNLSSNTTNNVILCLEL